MTFYNTKLPVIVALNVWQAEPAFMYIYIIGRLQRDIMFSEKHIHIRMFMQNAVHVIEPLNDSKDDQLLTVK